MWASPVLHDGARSPWRLGAGSIFFEEAALSPWPEGRGFRAAISMKITIPDTISACSVDDERTLSLVKAAMRWSDLLYEHGRLALAEFLDACLEEALEVLDDELEYYDAESWDDGDRVSGVEDYEDAAGDDAWESCMLVAAGDANLDAAREVFGPPPNDPPE